MVLKKERSIMKRLALTLVFLLTVAFAANAFATAVGDISAYADDQGNSCNIAAPAGLVTVYIVHKFSDGGSATGCRFKVATPAGMTFLAFNNAFTPIGNITTDISLGYGVCITTTTNLGSILYNSAGPAACTLVSVTAADNFANPIATDCSFGEYTVKTGSGILNPDGTCQCNIATQPTTWGSVKALYR
jgi:hypothetical protein